MKRWITQLTAWWSRLRARPDPTAPAIRYFPNEKAARAFNRARIEPMVLPPSIVKALRERHESTGEVRVHFHGVQDAKDWWRKPNDH